MHLHSRIRKLEQAMTIGRIAENQRDPDLVSLLACWGIPLEQCPFGVSARDWLAEAFKGARILAPRSLGGATQPKARRKLI